MIYKNSNYTKDSKIKISSNRLLTLDDIIFKVAKWCKRTFYSVILWLYLIKTQNIYSFIKVFSCFEVMIICLSWNMNISISEKMEFTIKIEAEDDGFVGCVLENNVSSFGDTQEEALAMTQEALKLWIESQMRFRLEKLSHIMNKQSEGIYKVAI